MQETGPRLLLFAPNLHGGGAERTLARLAEHWQSQGYSVTVLTLAAVNPADYPLPPEVRRITLDLTEVSTGRLSAIVANLRRVAVIRRTVNAVQPDAVISFIEQTNVLMLLATIGLRNQKRKLPVIISERIDPRSHPLPAPWPALRVRTYPHCTALVVLTEAMAEQFRPMVGGRPILRIPNGITAPVLPDEPFTRCSPPFLLGVGRLDTAKGFDRAIDAFARLADRHPQWKFVIAGEGPQRQPLEEQIAQLDLADRVVLLGRIGNLVPLYAAAEFFVLSSRNEGFSNALLEAMAAGLPAIAFESVSGVREIIRDGVDGFQVAEGMQVAEGKQVSESEGVTLTAAMDRLMSDEPLRQRMSRSARDVAARFSLEKFFSAWDEVVNRALAGDFSSNGGSSAA